MPLVQIKDGPLINFGDDLSPDEINYRIKTDIYPRLGMDERGQRPSSQIVVGNTPQVPTTGQPVTQDWVDRRLAMRNLRARQAALDVTGVAADKSLTFLSNLEGATTTGQEAAQMAEPHRQALELAQQATQSALGQPVTRYEAPSLPPVPVGAEAGPVEQTAAGVVNAAEGVVNFILTTEGMATLGLGAASATVRQGGLLALGGGMAAETPGAVAAAAEAAGGDAPLHEKVQAVAGAALAALGATPLFVPARVQVNAELRRLGVNTAAREELGPSNEPAGNPNHFPRAESIVQAFKDEDPARAWEIAAQIPAAGEANPYALQDARDLQEAAARNGAFGQLRVSNGQKVRDWARDVQMGAQGGPAPLTTRAAANTTALMGGEEQNAKTIRGYQRPANQVGQAGAGGQGGGGGNVEQAPPGGPEPVAARGGGPEGQAVAESVIALTDLSRPPASSLPEPVEAVKSTASSAIARVATGVAEAGGSFANLGHKVNDFLTGEVLPRTTKTDRATGEAGARYGASPVYAKRAADAFAHDVLRGVDPVKFGGVLTEDNLRDIKATAEDQADEIMQEAEAEARRGHPSVATAKAQEAVDLREQVDHVTSIIGKEGSPFANEEAYRQFLDEPATQAAIERHRQRYEAEINPLYRQARDLAPETELAGRGLETGARINLFVPPEGGGVPQVRVTPDLKATYKKRTRFANRATGAADAYGLDYRDIMQNTYAGLLEIANKNEFDRQLVASGNAVIDRPGLRPELKGEETQSFPLRARTVLTPEGAVVPQDKMIYVRKALAQEYLGASNARLDSDGVLKRVLDYTNIAAIAGLVDPVVHIGNLTTALYTRPATTGGLAADTALGLVPPAHLAVAVGRALQKGFTNNREQLASLARIGALRDESHAGRVSQLLGWYDRSVRLVLDDAYQRLAKEGLVKASETARREFVNSVGNYNKRVQDSWTVGLHGSGVAPFVVAGKTFGKLAVDTATLSPGVEARGEWQALALRANVLSKWLGVGAGVALWNYINTGQALGRPGTPLGNVDTGRNDVAGRMISRGVSDWFGMGRALRVTGLRAGVDTTRLGLGKSDVLDAMLRDAINAQIAPLAGPVVQAASIGLTGHPAAVEVRRKGLPAAPGESHFMANAATAATEVNSVVAGIHEMIQPGKTWKDFMARQFPRYGEKQGMPESMAGKFPQIITKAHTKEFTDAVVSEARRMPVMARPGWLQEQLQRVPESERTKTFKEFKSRVLAHP